MILPTALFAAMTVRPAASPKPSQDQQSPDAQTQSIAEAALQASCLDHANRLRTAPYLLSVMHTGVHNCVASLLTKILISHLHSLRWYESIVSYSTRLSALAQFRRITAAPAACFLR